MKPLCRRCRRVPHTGVLIELCDACFDTWEADHNAKCDASPTGRRELSDKEFEYFADGPNIVRRN